MKKMSMSLIAITLFVPACSNNVITPTPSNSGEPTNSCNNCIPPLSYEFSGYYGFDIVTDVGKYSINEIAYNKKNISIKGLFDIEEELSTNDISLYFETTDASNSGAGNNIIKEKTFAKLEFDYSTKQLEKGFVGESTLYFKVDDNALSLMKEDKYRIIYTDFGMGNINFTNGKNRAIKCSGIKNDVDLKIFSEQQFLNVFYEAIPFDRYALDRLNQTTTKIVVPLPKDNDYYNIIPQYVGNKTL